MMHALGNQRARRQSKQSKRSKLKCTIRSVLVAVIFVLPTAIWGACAVCAFWAYLLAPLRRSEPPRWAPAALALLSVVASFGFAIDCGCMHRKFEVEYRTVADEEEEGAGKVVVAEAVALGDDEADGAVDAAALAAADLQQQRDGSRRSELEERRRKRTALLVVYRLVRLVPVVLLALFTLALALFFATIGPANGLCGHASCGADVSWSLIGCAAYVAWAFALTLSIILAVRRRKILLAGSESSASVSAAARDAAAGVVTEPRQDD